MSEHVILLHGLWMRGFALSLLHHRLMEAGFRVHRFDYLSVAGSEQRILDRLHARMAGLAGEAEAVHLVDTVWVDCLRYARAANRARFHEGASFALARRCAVARPRAAWRVGGAVGRSCSVTTGS